MSAPASEAAAAGVNNALATAARGRRLVVIATPVLLLGGTEMQMLQLVRALAGGGAPVVVQCYHEYDERIVAAFEEAGASVVLHRVPRSGGLVLLFGELLRYYRRVRPALVHVQYLAPGLVPILAARCARVPVVFGTVHVAGAGFHGRKARFLLRVAARICDTFICVSATTERFWFGISRVYDPDSPPPLLRGTHVTIYDGVDVDGIRSSVAAAVRDSPQRSPGRVIGFVGRLAEQKGLDVLLHALPEILVSRPEVLLLVVGDGPDRDSLRRRAEELGVAERVRWLGPLAQAAVFTFLARVDLIAMPSRYEGFGLVAAEAMAAGVPVVATAVAGLSEVVEDGRTGLLVPVEDPAALARAVGSLLDDPALAQRLGASGRERVERLYSRQRHDRALLQLYRSWLDRWSAA